MGPALRPQVKLVAGRWFTPGKREVVVSRKFADRFANFEIGGKFKSSGSELTVVGWLDGGNSAFDSETWMDADEARKLFDRENYSSVLARVSNEQAGLALSEPLAGGPAAPRLCRPRGRRRPEGRNPRPSLRRAAAAPARRRRCARA